MKKISTLFSKDPNDLSKVINIINPDNRWVYDGEAIPTQKFDGTAAAIINGEIYKRYDAKKGKQAPDGAIPCQDPDPITGHHPHWVKCNREDPNDRYFFEAFEILENKEDGTYELCGEKINGNPEKIEGHQLLKHGCAILGIPDWTFDGLKSFLAESDIEGIVFHHKEDDRMCKLRKSDYGLTR